MGICKCSGKSQGLKFSPLADIEALEKQEVKGDTGLSNSWLGTEGVPRCTHRALQQRLGVVLVLGS